MKETKPVTVYCPKCGRRVGEYDGKSSINLIAKCKHCRKQVIYNIETKETILKPLPARTTSGGLTF